MYHTFFTLFFLFSNSIPEYTFDVTSNTLTVKGCPKDEPNCRIEQNDYQKSGPYSTYIKITIEPGATAIGKNAFYQSTSLKEINISSWITEINNPFCQGCTSLANIYFSSPNQYYETDEYGNLYERGRKKLLKSPPIRTDIVIDENTEEIIELSFYHSETKHLKIPKNVAIIQKNSFYGSKIEKLEFDSESKIKSLSSLSLASQMNILNIIFPPSLESLGDGSVSQNPSLTSVEFPLDSRLYTIRSDVFKGDSNLKQIVLPNTTSVIGDNAFSSCSLLSTIILSKNLSDLSGSAFSGCSSISSIIIPASNEHYTSIDGALYSKRKDEVFIIPSMSESFNIPTELLKIGQTALQACSRLVRLEIAPNHTKFLEDEQILVDKDTMTALAIVGGAEKVELPNGVLSLGPYFAYGCSKLTNVSLQKEISSIGDYCFANSSITSIVLSDELSYVGISAFEGCSKLENITFPKNSILKFGSGPFIRCSSINEMIFECNVSNIPYRFCRYCGAKNIEFRKDGFTMIDQGSFEEMGRLVSISFPKSLQIISTYSLTSGFKNIKFPYGCGVRIVQSNGLSWSSIESITFGTDLESLHSNAFQYCSKLKEINIPENSKLFDLSQTGIFSYCTLLKTFNVPKSVTKVSSSIFIGCASLLSITANNSDSFISTNGILYDKRNNELILVACPPGLSIANVAENVTELAKQCFYTCTKLSSISFPDSSTFETIGENVFYGCSNLKFVGVPRNVQSISGSTFSGCKSLNTVEFGSLSLLEELGTGIFSGCSKLENINLEICASLKIIPAKCFEGCNQLNTLVLPKSLETIGISSFSKCGIKLISFEQCQKLKKIDMLSFSECANLENIVFPISLEFIGNNAFMKSGLKGTLLLPSNITSVGEGSLSKCDLKQVIYCGTNSLSEDAFLGQLVEVHVQRRYKWSICLGMNPQHDVADECYISTVVPVHAITISAISIQEVLISDALMHSAKTEGGK